MKRETSVSVTDLQERECKELSDCVKRLALRGSLSLPSAPASPVSATRTPLSSGASTPNLSPVVSLAGSESPEHLSSSGASYASTELLSRPLPSQPIAPLFHPSLVPLMPSPTTSAAAPIITANGRTFSQGGTVLDTVCARDAFDIRYELGGEIGRGGFSVVHQCRHRQSQRDYAVKIVDLRPLRLRERFNPARLRREIDIMKKLRHPSIVEFIDGFETESQLLMVMELCPGQELFDVILARQCFSEADAKPIFSQVANAIYYLHCLNIIHRDVKPENILILDQPDERGLPVAKLLDFGLSKNAGAGSAAKTFVGTPCYLAPEVEFTAKGLGGTYGLPADCWSLGAVLYVMLVARFPEFEHDPVTNSIVLKLPQQLWAHVSREAQDLVRSLMTTDPRYRLTAREALLHPWLSSYGYGMSATDLEAIAVSSYDLGQHLQREAEAEAELAQHEEDEYRFPRSGTGVGAGAGTGTGARNMDVSEVTAGGAAVPVHLAMVLRSQNPYQQQQHHQQQQLHQQQHQLQQQQQQQQQQQHQRRAIGNGDAGIVGPLGHPTTLGGVGPIVQGPDQLQISSLLQLRSSIAACFEEAYASYRDFPDVARQVTQGAFLCRQQFEESSKMLAKVDETARSVLNTFPDLVLAVEEGEPLLAATIFGNVRSWIGDLREMVTKTQLANRKSMAQIQTILERGALRLSQHSREQRAAASAAVSAAATAATAAITAAANSGTGGGGGGGPRGLFPKKLVDAMKHMSVGQGGGGLGLGAAVGPGLMAAVHDSLGAGAGTSSNGDLEALTQEQVWGLFMTLFGQAGGDGAGGRGVGSNSAASRDSSGSGSRSRSGSQSMFDEGDSWLGLGEEDEDSGMVVGGGGDVDLALDGAGGAGDDSTLAMAMAMASSPRHSSAGAGAGQAGSSQTPSAASSSASATALALGPPSIFIPERDLIGTGADSTSLVPSGGHSPVAASRLAEALHKLREVDLILENLSMFWANTEVVLDSLTKKGQAVEQLIGFSQKPRLMARFRERVSEYMSFWQNIANHCQRYAHGVTHSHSAGGYAFLEGQGHSHGHGHSGHSSTGGLGMGGMGSPVPAPGLGMVDEFESGVLGEIFRSSSQMAALQGFNSGHGQGHGHGHGLGGHVNKMDSR